MIHGMVLVAKEKGMTSHDVVEEIRRIFHIRKAGHFGTLDPAATGLLLVALGHATRFFGFYIEKQKMYRAVIRFGFSTDSYDAEGIPSGEEKEINLNHLNITALLAPFRGKIMQTPPVFSAKKYKGKPLYQYARKKIEVSPSAVPVTIYQLQEMILDKKRLQVDALVSSGTYIRSLAHDIGRAAGVGAHLQELVRLRVGDYSLAQANHLHEIKYHVHKNQLEKVVIPIESLLPEFSKIIVSAGGRRSVINGMPLGSRDILKIFPASHPENFRIFDDEGKLLAIAVKENRSQSFRPSMVFPDL